ncbi:PucR family transcriptional regulator [Virgibacillus halodenitrificans]|uniref:PucR family transcriptional regulator n=1 Tax=Virgibacillus halodenitrificans TaxID=1482 RepID=UPI0002FF9BCE|nr:PucR family transcriptional regulator [Virgibacillus halodenitrificans]
MYVTINDVIKIDSFKGVEVIAGEAGLARRVSNVFFMEVPDIFSYIDEHGLLLTTLYPVADKPEEIDALIPKLAEMNIAGIAVKPGRYVAEIPASMIEQANKYGIPLMKLPDDANLSILSNQILTKLLDVRTSVLEFRNKMHQQLLDLLLEGADLNRFVHSIAKLIDAPVLLLNTELECIASSINTEQKEIKVLHQSNHLEQYSRKTNNLTVQINDHAYEKNDIFIQSIYAGESEFGYLVILLEKETNITENLIVAVEQASFLVAFLFQTEQSLLQKERNHLNSFVRDIFNDQYTSQTEVMEKAKVFKWKLSFPLVILSIKTNIKESEKKLSIYYRMLDSGLIERMISEILDIPIQNCKLTYYNDSLICFISFTSEKRLKENLQQLGETIISRFGKNSHLGISISDTVDSINQIREHYSNSTLVYNIYKESLEHQSFVHFYEDIGLFRLFHYIEDSSILEKFVTEKLGSVIEYDERKDANLLETLRYYIKNNTNLQKTADDMFVHYNTMRYRMNKLKELGIDVKSGFELTDISVAYQLYHYLKTQKK